MKRLLSKHILGMSIETVVVCGLIIVWLCIQNHRIDAFEKKINGRVYDMYESFIVVLDTLQFLVYTDDMNKMKQ